MTKLIRYASIYSKCAGIIEQTVHVLLDVVGLIPGLGEPADVTNALLYAKENKFLSAALSLISIIPGIGDIVGKGGKIALWITEHLVSNDTVNAFTEKTIGKLKDLIKRNTFLVDKIFTKVAENGQFRPFIPEMRKALDEFVTEEETEEETEI